MPVLRIGDDTIDFDVYLAEEYEYASEISSNPVEQGVDLVDNQRPLPTRVSLRVIVTNTPTRLPVFGAQNVSVVPDPAVLTFNGRFDRVRDVPLRLRQAQLNAESGLFLGRQGLMEPVLIEGVSVPLDTSDGVELVVDLIQIRVGSTNFVAVPLPVPSEPRGGKKRNRGKKPSQEVKKPGRNRSLARKLGIFNPAGVN